MKTVSLSPLKQPRGHINAPNVREILKRPSPQMVHYHFFTHIEVVEFFTTLEFATSLVTPHTSLSPGCLLTVLLLSPRMRDTRRESSMLFTVYTLYALTSTFLPSALLDLIFLPCYRSGCPSDPQRV